MDREDWNSVPSEHREEWLHIFQASQECLNLSPPCPICGKVALHRWYQVGQSIECTIESRKFVARGALWEWCRSCRSYEHYSALVPDWWSCDLQVDTKHLTALPVIIEVARRELLDR